MRLAFIVSGFYSGGFTTSLNNLISNLDKNIEIDVFVFNSILGDANLVPDKVTIKHLKHNLSSLNKLRLKFKLLFDKQYMTLRKTNPNSIVLRQIYYMYYVQTCMEKIDLTSYDAVISWEELQCNYYLAFNVKAKNKISYIHPDYEMAGYSAIHDKKMLDRVDYLACVTQSNCDKLKNIFNSSKIIYIPNTLNLEVLYEKANVCNEELKEGFNIVTVCRLDNKSKALDRMVEIVNDLNKYYKFTWYVVGDGPDREMLESLMLQKNINNIILVGNKINPFGYVKSANLFVLQSYYEGKPMCIDEALALNVPVLVTNYISAKEQVPLEGGFIVENTKESIYNELSSILENKDILLDKKSFLEGVDKKHYSNVQAFMDAVERGIK